MENGRLVPGRVPMMRRLDPTARRGFWPEPELAAVLAAPDAAGRGDAGRRRRGAQRSSSATPHGHRPRHDAPADDVIDGARAAGLKTVPTGIEHGTVTLVVAGRPFEVTTLREDVETDGRHAVVRFGRDFAADAARRDFTVNALSARAPTAGSTTPSAVSPISRRRVFASSAIRPARIREDYLRILRFFRFHAGYGEGPPDVPALAACIAARAAWRAYRGSASGASS